jgi:AcrR family transcriptional regulator
MLRAAYELMSERGYALTTIEAIAERAGVAVQTLYFTFRNKSAILTEVFHAVVVGFDRWSPSVDADVHADHSAVLRERVPWFRTFEDEPDARRALRIYVDGSIEILARVAPLVAATSAIGDPEVHAVRERSERLREEAAGIILRSLKAKEPLREGLTLARAIDVFLVLTSAETFHQLSAGRRWSTPEIKRWLVDSMSQQLLGR